MNFAFHTFWTFLLDTSILPKSYQWGEWVGFGGWVKWVGWLAPKVKVFVSAPDILIMVYQIRLMMFLLKMVDYSMSFLLLSTWIFFWRTSRGDHSGPFLFSELFCGTPPSCLKVMGWVVVGGLQDFSVSPSPLLGLLGLELGWTGLGLGIKGMGTRAWQKVLRFDLHLTTRYLDPILNAITLYLN